MDIDDSPSSFRRAQTLIRLSDNSSPSPVRATPSEQNFDVFYEKLRFIPVGFQNHTAFKQLLKPAPAVKIPSISSPTKPAAVTSATSVLMTRAASMSESPVNNKSLARKGTLEMQMLPYNKTKQFPIASSKEVPSPYTARKGSPREPILSTLVRSSSLATIKASIMNIKGPLSRKNSQDSIVAPSSYRTIGSPSSKKEKVVIVKKKQSFLLTDRDSDKPPPEVVRLMEIEREAKETANRIAGGGSREFEKAISLYKKFNPKQLFDLEPKSETERHFTIRVKSLLSTEPKQSRQGNRKMSLPKKTVSSTANTAWDSNQLEREFSNFGSLFQPGAIHAIKHSKPQVEVKVEEKEVECADVLGMNEMENLQRMSELKDVLAPEKTLSEDEKNFLNLVKQGADVAKLKYLISSNRRLVNIKDNRKETPLHWAVKKDHYEIVELLCREGADVHATDIGSRKPIDIAKRQGNGRVIKRLQDQMFV